ncbi:ABC transporter permease [Adhaeribacter pallidiroseus]|uniref:Putative peptide ABC transporter permease protein n=1 Tax=Adhaeribacter pallidiroseus TaxID=2072847 RepID=A0A369QQ63_9BACT|nr:ABC transporter permease [Adhaeribacter pallidiroseus]RDC65377.1 putative peptide ABC transporter permease protein [Adhaeribacter pallidiroseus]
MSPQQNKTGKWRWPERLAGGYLLLFLLMAVVVPATGLIQHPYENTQSGPSYQPPYIFSFSTSGNSTNIYWLGTDRVGQDVLAILIFGARTALVVSLPAMLLATIMGVVLGSLAGFWGNSGIRVSVAACVLGLSGLLAAGYYAFCVRQVHWLNAFQSGTFSILQELGIAFTIFTGFGIIGWLLTTVAIKIGLKKTITLPIDHFVLRAIEITGAIPRLLLIMCLIAFAKPALVNVVVLAALTYWTSIARLVRGELLQVKELPYIEAAQVAGIANWRILLKQALPNALPPVIVAIAFGLGNLISLEATLSYLGIGIPAYEASWGKLIKGILQNPKAWWLVVFPALTLCFTILSLQIMAERLLKKLSPRQQQF